jgi:hypothetical protein
VYDSPDAPLGSSKCTGIALNGLVNFFDGFPAVTGMSGKSFPVI